MQAQPRAARSAQAGQVHEDAGRVRAFGYLGSRDDIDTGQLACDDQAAERSPKTRGFRCTTSDVEL